MQEIAWIVEEVEHVKTPREETAPEVRNTRQRRTVVASLATQDGFHSAQDLHRIIAEDGDRVSLATVYRILQSLEQAGEVDVLRDEEGQSLYRQCARQEHHHHLLCRRCGRAEDISAEMVERWAERIGAEFGYTGIAHTVEVTGFCPRCTRELAAEAAEREDARTAQ